MFKNIESGKAQVNFIILGLIVIVSAIFALGLPSFEPPTGNEVTLVEKDQGAAKKTLQLGTLNKTAPVIPTPSVTFCPKYQQVDLNTCKCSEFAICVYKDDPTTSCWLAAPYCAGLFACPTDPPDCVHSPTTRCRDPGGCPGGSLYGGCPSQCNKDFEEGKCLAECVAKPVIYLYPTQPTYVNVRLDIPGKITVSDPLYPEGGWNNVLAYPDGKLFYNNRAYPYLYYETEVAKINRPAQGIVTTKDTLESTLRFITLKLGLNSFEQQDFLEYWVSKLNSLNSPYILIQLLPVAEKERIDRVEVNPPPDTRIELLFSFKPLSDPISIQPLVLPDSPPKRHGFTLVEWGGGIER